MRCAINNIFGLALKYKIRQIEKNCLLQAKPHTKQEFLKLHGYDTIQYTILGI